MPGYSHTSAVRRHLGSLPDLRIFELTAAGAYSNTSRLDDQQIAGKLARMDANDLRYQCGFRRARKPVELQQDYAGNLQALANHQLAEIVVFRDEDAVITLCRTQDVFICRSRSRFLDGRHVETGSAKPLNDKA